VLRAAILSLGVLMLLQDTGANGVCLGVFDLCSDELATE
jgi:hypothetical protein